MKEHGGSPAVGDFMVVGSAEGYAVERVVPANRREVVSTTLRRLAALDAARTLARDSKTRAWAYELDNSYSKLSE